MSATTPITPPPPPKRGRGRPTGPPKTKNTKKRKKDTGSDNESTQWVPEFTEIEKILQAVHKLGQKNNWDTILKGNNSIYKLNLIFRLTKSTNQDALEARTPS
jgi:hypothetical protein